MRQLYILHRQFNKILMKTVNGFLHLFVTFGTLFILRKQAFSVDVFFGFSLRNEFEAKRLA